MFSAISAAARGAALYLARAESYQLMASSGASSFPERITARANDEAVDAASATMPDASISPLGSLWLLIVQGELPSGEELETLGHLLDASSPMFDEEPLDRPDGASLASMIVDAQASGASSLCFFALDTSVSAKKIVEAHAGASFDAVASAIAAAFSRSLGPSGKVYSLSSSVFVCEYPSHAKADPELFSVQAARSTTRRLGLAFEGVATGPYYVCVPGSASADSGVRSFFDGL